MKSSKAGVPPTETWKLSFWRTILTSHLDYSRPWADDTHLVEAASLGWGKFPGRDMAVSYKQRKFQEFAGMCVSVLTGSSGQHRIAPTPCSLPHSYPFASNKFTHLGRGLWKFGFISLPGETYRRNITGGTIALTATADLGAAVAILYSLPLLPILDSVLVLC